MQINNVRPASVKTGLLAILLLVTSTFISCKKNDDKKAACRISVVDFPSQNLSYHLTYNSNGKLKKLTGGSTVVMYDYSGNKTTITTFNSERFVSKTIATVNAAGLAINARTENNAAGTEWANAAYEYNGTELKKYIYTSSDKADTIITTFIWLNQNLTGVIDISTADFDYYVDKPSQSGDYFSLTQLVQGYEIVRNKNLVKSGDGQHFTYQFGMRGISSLTVTSGNDTSMIDYEYGCN